MPVSAAQAGAGGRGLWISPARIQELPTSGSAWTSLKTAADGALGTPNIADQDSDHDVRTLAVALVYAKTGDPAYRVKAANAIMSAVGTERGGRTLALGRNLVSYVVAADLIDLAGYDPALDATFRSWLSAVRTETMSDGRSLVQTDEVRANNWGTNAGASRAAADAYLSDIGDLGRAARVFRGWLGDRSAYAGFKFGDLSWQGDPGSPVGINGIGATILGHDVDGVLPDDQRRAGSFSWPPPKENYVWGGLGPAFIEAQLLFNAGYGDVYGWSSSALHRAIDWLYTVADFAAQGDDTWVPWLANAAYGTSLPTSAAGMGKPMAWTDWTHGGATSQTTSPTTTTEPAPQPTTTTDPTTTTTDPNATSAAPAPQPTTTTDPAPGTNGTDLLFAAIADAQVRAQKATINYGSEPTLRVKADQYVSYLTFTVSGLTGPPQSAKLRLYVVDAGRDGGSVYLVDSSWQETAITWSSAPALAGSPVAHLGTPTTGAWVEADLGSAISGNGTYSFAIVGAASNSVFYASREDGRAPVLVVAPA